MEQNTQAQSSEVVAEQSVQATETQQTEQSETSKQFSAEDLARRLKVVNAEAKEYRLKLQEEKRKREEEAKQRLESEGKFKELADQYKNEADSAKSYSQKLKEAFTATKIADQVSIEASRFGCIDSEVLLNIIDMEQISIDDSFQVDATAIKKQLEDIRNKKPYLFKREAPKVHDINPGTGKIEAPKQDISKLSLGQRAALLAELKNQGK